jgi:hypothetical protein
MPTGQTGTSGHSAVSDVGSVVPPEGSDYFLCADEEIDDAVMAMCNGPTIELGCGSGRLVAHLIR